MLLTFQVLGSVALVVAVLWFMWRLPRRSESLFGWAPPMALASPWLGVFAIIASASLWFAPNPRTWTPVVFLLLDPAAVACGTLVLWIYRGYEAPGDAIPMQRLQAKVGITLGLVAVVIGYVYVAMTTT